MKALILAAGFGTRLLPFTESMPKPLFPLGGKPVLRIIVEKLGRAGCDAALVNTHHLHEKIEAYVAEENFPFPVSTNYEKEIAGTGGAIKNAAAFFNGEPFMAINSDIITDINLAEVFEFHIGHSHPATLVLHDFSRHSKVSTDNKNFITGFDGCRKKGSLAFTGIQAVDSATASFIPEKGFSNSIDIYEKMIGEGIKIKAFIAEKKILERHRTA